MFTHGGKTRNERRKIKRHTGSKKGKRREMEGRKDEGAEREKREREQWRQ